jgi:exodeoxyribonuclease V beta subunit
VVCHQGRYYVMDYKSNYLGEDRSAYGGDAMAAAIREHRYDLQYVLYTLALHRLLKARLPGYSYRRDVGGAVYLFLRGVDAQGRGLFTDKPPEGLIVHLDACFAGKEMDHEL